MLPHSIEYVAAGVREPAIIAESEKNLAHECGGPGVSVQRAEIRHEKAEKELLTCRKVRERDVMGHTTRHSRKSTSGRSCK